RLVGGGRAGGSTATEPIGTPAGQRPSSGRLGLHSSRPRPRVARGNVSCTTPQTASPQSPSRQSRPYHVGRNGARQIVVTWVRRSVRLMTTALSTGGERNCFYAGFVGGPPRATERTRWVL